MESIAKEIMIRTVITLAVFVLVMLIFGAVWHKKEDCACHQGGGKSCGGGSAAGGQEQTLGLTTSTSL